MDVAMINPILVAFAEILPQIGFQKVEKKSVALVGSTIDYDGILLNIAMIGSIKGVILIGMDLDSAKRFASKMMMGMELAEFDKLAQSAISEMGNMVCANACTQYSKINVSGLDISPPTLMIGAKGQATLPVLQALTILFSVDDIPVKVYVGLV
ncbi:MAG TPA: chemotaxis protein CheX [Patescibacteria group bacterium]|nr:chemotaxis protein CheX [Patescibacteria group bacterium]